MAVNKVVYNTENGEETLIDLTGDTVAPETLAEGATAHDASGNIIEGVGKTTSVLYTEQALNDEQKEQARTNINAGSKADIEVLSETVGHHTDTLADLRAKVDGANVEIEVFSDNLITSWVDGKYAQAKEYFIDYGKMSYGTADISGYEYIVVTPYIEPSSVSFPFILYSADGVTQLTGSYEDFEQLADGSYKVKIPATTPAITGIRLNILTSNKANSFVKGVRTENQNVKGSIYKYTDSLNKPFDFSGKTAIAFGDSISAGVSSPNFELVDSFVELFAEKVGLSLVNASVSGSCIADTTSTSSIYNTIIGFTTQKDLIFICGGTNDFNTSKPLGNYGDTTADTFYGALKSICEHFKTNFSNSTIIFVTPIPYTKGSQYCNIINTVGHNLNDYRNAIYEVATTYGYNVVDGSDIGMPEGQGGWSNYMCADSDGCHPTAEGHKLYARNLCTKLL